ncbi:MAG: Biotin carboxyl carrier protein of acetyl-CoA carboxylase, partial [uncultured Gemmatimonadetes bacterium]
RRARRCPGRPRGGEPGGDQEPHGGDLLPLPRARGPGVRGARLAHLQGADAVHPGGDEADERAGVGSRRDRARDPGGQRRAGGVRAGPLPHRAGRL